MTSPDEALRLAQGYAEQLVNEHSAEWLRDCNAIARAYIALSTRSCSEPVAWLYSMGKPGLRTEFASIDPNDSTHWPKDQWTNGYTVRPLHLGCSDCAEFKRMQAELEEFRRSWAILNNRFERTEKARLLLLEMRNAAEQRAEAAERALKGKG